MGLIFAWNEEKARANYGKHGITFNEGATVFGDPLSVSIPDPLHSIDEERWVTIGESSERRILTVVHAERDTAIRIISARLATRQERRDYEEGINPSR